MLGTLVAGRISIACASLSAAKSGLTIAVRYTASAASSDRRPAPRSARPRLHHHAARLLPRLATAYALDFALKDARPALRHRADDDAQEIETLAAALKAFASDWTVDTLQACREACGGRATSPSTASAALRADTDVFTTFEGANHVLYQLVARGRLTEYRDQFGELKLWNVARTSPAAPPPASPSSIRSSRAAPSRAPARSRLPRAALRYREERLLASLARRLKQRIDDGMDSVRCAQRVPGPRRRAGPRLRRALHPRAVPRRYKGLSRPGLRAVLEPLAALYALDRLEARSAWLLEAGYVEPAKSRAIRRQVNDLCLEPATPGAGARRRVRHSRRPARGRRSRQRLTRFPLLAGRPRTHLETSGLWSPFGPQRGGGPSARLGGAAKETGNDHENPAAAGQLDGGHRDTADHGAGAGFSRVCTACARPRGGSRRSRGGQPAVRASCRRLPRPASENGDRALELYVSSRTASWCAGVRARARCASGSRPHRRSGLRLGRVAFPTAQELAHDLVAYMQFNLDALRKN
jgi:hypothetical protein